MAVKILRESNEKNYTELINNVIHTGKIPDYAVDILPEELAEMLIEMHEARNNLEKAISQASSALRSKDRKLAHQTLLKIRELK